MVYNGMKHHDVYIGMLIFYTFSHTPALMQETALSTSPTPKVTILERIVDFKKWIKPHINPVHGHSNPHCFKFLKGADENVHMFYKHWSDDAWTEKEETLIILKVYKLSAI